MDIALVFDAQLPTADAQQQTDRRPIPPRIELSSTLGAALPPHRRTLVAGTTAGNGLFRVACLAAATPLISAITIAITKESGKRNLVHRTTEHGATSDPQARPRPPDPGLTEMHTPLGQAGVSW